MKKTFFITTIMLFLTSIFIFSSVARDKIWSKSEAENLDDTPQVETKKAEGKIQVALLLDTSNSMDGLIEQAKNRLWDIVNTMSTLEYKNEETQLEIALYQYGNSNLSQEEYYVQKVLDFTTDLDDISEKLFALRTKGGEEYCGAVMKNAVENLEWANGRRDIRLIYIAGNEPFDQGPIHFQDVIRHQLSPKGIVVNTIFCGNYNEGQNTNWAKGALLAEGKYFAINSDQEVRHIASPYDDDIIRCNDHLKQTYIGYGSEKEAKMEKMVAEDANAESLSQENYTKRIVSKSKSKIYKNDTWDLVDKYDGKLDQVKDIKEKNLPKEMQSMSPEEKVNYVKQKSAERKKVQKEITELNKKRNEYIRNKKADEGENDDLGMAITNSILELATNKKYTIVEN